MGKLGTNTISNIATKLWNMISIYIFIPIYIKILGETSYGLVSFFATLQTTLNILGLGLSNTLRREFAVGKDTENNRVRKYKLLRSVETIYFAIGSVIVCICICGSNLISEKWLNIETLDSDMVAIVISLMGISIALQLIANLYAGCLLGLEYQVLANAISIVWSAGKSIGSLLIVILIAPNLIIFYGWHILTDVIYLVFLRKSVKIKLHLKSKVRWHIKDISNMRNIWKYTCGILFISLIVLVNKQLDKVIISKFLTLTELGAYNVATTLGSLSTIIPTALYTTFFPRFTNYATTNNHLKLEDEFKRINKVAGLILSSMGAFIAIYALPLIQVWTKSYIYIDTLGGVASIVVLAVTISEYQEIPYALALAYGKTKYNVLVGGAFIPIVCLATYFSVIRYGLLGAALVYLIVMTLQTLLYEFLIYKNFIKKNPMYLIFKDTVLPLIICVLAAVISKNITETITSNPWLEIGIAIVSGAGTLLILVFIFARKDIRVLIKKGEENK